MTILRNIVPASTRLFWKCLFLNFCGSVFGLTRNKTFLATAAIRGRGPRILIFDDHVPTPNRDAGGLRMLIILTMLAKWAQPVFVPFRRLDLQEAQQALAKAGIEVSSLVDYRKLLKERGFTVAILSRPDVADAVLPSLRRLSPKTKIVFDTVDIAFQRLQREYELTGDTRFELEAKRYRKLERRLARASDQVWCVTPEDKGALAAQAPEANITIIPTIHAPQGRGKAFEEREGLLFVGLFLHRPNTDAVLYFLREIYPNVLSRLPNLKFYVVGRHPPPEILAYASPSLSIVGYAPDLTPYLDSCRLFVAPLRYGAGIKGKIGQALAHGLPVITTAIGAEGFGLTDAREAMIADDPQGFANALIRAYLDKQCWQHLSDHGYKHIQNKFAPHIIERKVYQSIKGLSE